MLERKERIFQAGRAAGLLEASQSALSVAGILQNSISESQAVHIEKLYGDLRREDGRYFKTLEALSAALHEVLDLRSELAAAKQRIDDLESENLRLKPADRKIPIPLRRAGILLHSTIPRKKT